MGSRAIDLAGLQSRAFAPADWGTPDTGYQATVDTAARRGINQRYAEGISQAAFEDKARGNPTERAIEAQNITRQYEEGLPYGATSHVSATYGAGAGPGLEGAEVGSEGTGERRLGIPSIGQVRNIELAAVQAQSKYSPEKRAEAALDLSRARIQDELMKLDQNLREDVAAGRLRPEVAQARYYDAAQKAQKYVEMLKPGFPSMSLADALLNNQGRGNPGQTAQSAMDQEKR